MAKSRRKPTRVSEEELQRALDALVDNMGPDRVTPLQGIAPSANALLVLKGAVSTNSRATYLLTLLVQGGAIERIENSHKVRVVRTTLKQETSSSKPVPVPGADTERIPEGTRQKYEDTIRRLAAEVDRLRLRVEVLDERLAKTESEPSGDVLRIMQRVLGEG